MFFRWYSGRLDKLLYVPLPTPEDRVSILKALSVGINLSPEVDLRSVATSPRADGYSGADCAALLREAGLAVLKEDITASNLYKVNTEATKSLCIAPRHFDYAFSHVIPSVSRKDQARYNRMRDRMAHARSRGAVIADVAAEDGDDLPFAFTSAATNGEAIPSVSQKDQARYNLMRDSMAHARSRGAVIADVAAEDEDVLPFTFTCSAPYGEAIPSVSQKDQFRYNLMRDRIAHARSREASIARWDDLPFTTTSSASKGEKAKESNVSDTVLN